MGVRSLTSAVLCVFPKYKCFLLRKHRTRSEIIHLILTWYCCSVHSPHSHFAICLINVLLAKENFFPVQDLIQEDVLCFAFMSLSSPWTWDNSSFFRDLDIFEEHRSLILWNVLHLGSTWCFLLIRFRLYIFGKIQNKAKTSPEVMFCPSQRCCEWTWLTWFRRLFAVKLLFLASWFLSIPPVGDSVTVLSPIRLSASSFSTLLIFAGNSFYCDGHQTVIFQLCYSFCIYLLHILL